MRSSGARGVLALQVECDRHFHQNHRIDLSGLSTGLKTAKGGERLAGKRSAGDALRYGQVKATKLRSAATR